MDLYVSDSLADSLSDGLLNELRSTGTFSDETTDVVGKDPSMVIGALDLSFGFVLAFQIRYPALQASKKAVNKSRGSILPSDRIGVAGREMKSISTSPLTLVVYPRSGPLCITHLKRRDKPETRAVQTALTGG